MSENEDVYVTFSLAKYPFLKDIKIGEDGEANFKGEIIEQGKKDDYPGMPVDLGDEEESNDEDKEDEIYHDITFSDLTPARKNVRV